MANQSWLDGFAVDVVTDDPSGAIATLESLGLEIVHLPASMSVLDSLGLEVVHVPESETVIDALTISVIWAEKTGPVGPTYCDHTTVVDSVADVEGAGSTGWRTEGGDHVGSSGHIQVGALAQAPHTRPWYPVLHWVQVQPRRDPSHR
jgi:hypothetical protein